MKKIMGVLALTVVVLAQGVGPLVAQDDVIRPNGPFDVIKWVQPPDMINGWNVPSWGTAVPDDMPVLLIVAADDWKCPDGRPITDIHWWGSYEIGEPGSLVAFELSIHADVPASECCPSHPGELLWSTLAFVGAGEGGVTEESFGLNFSGDVMHYSYYFPEEQYFEQEEGSIYWLNVVGLRDISDNQTVWGWHTAMRPGPDNGLDAAVGIYDYDPETGDYTRWGALYDSQCAVQLAFAFSTVPEPTSLALFGTGVLTVAALVRRRRLR